MVISITHREKVNRGAEAVHEVDNLRSTPNQATNNPHTSDSPEVFNILKSMHYTEKRLLIV